MTVAAEPPSIPAGLKTGAEIKCAACNNINATKVCKACIATPDLNGKPLKTYYCDAKCQKSHWEDHKAACKAHQQRKALYRAGEIAQSVFYMYRRLVFDKKLKAVQFNGDDIVIYDDFYEDGNEIGPARALDTCLVPFPDHLFRQERDKQAVLVFLTCTDALAYMYPLIALMLKGICHNFQTDLCEVLLKPKHHNRHIEEIKPDGETLNQSTIRHLVLQVTLKSGEVYAFDITAAQYGHYDTIIPWEVYTRTRVDQTLEKTPFGRAQMQAYQSCNQEGWTGAIMMMNKVWCRKLEKLLDASEHDLPLAKVLRYADTEFAVAREKFMRRITLGFSVCQERCQSQPFSRNLFVFEEMIDKVETYKDENGVQVLKVT